MTLALEDRLELMSLPGRYGNAMDDRDWGALALIFTDDAVFDVRPMGVRMEGLAEIVAFMDSTEAHPLGHLMTNVVVDQEDAKTLVRFRAIFPILNEDGAASPSRIAFAFYYDEMAKTAAGWRVRNRLVTRAPRDMKPTRADLRRNLGLTRLLADERAAPPSRRAVLPARS